MNEATQIDIKQLILEAREAPLGFDAPAWA